MLEGGEVRNRLVIQLYLLFQAAGKHGARRSREERVESEDQIHYWVPRVRLMFAAEDPTVFAQRVAHAHLAR